MAGEINTMGDLRRFIIDVMLECREGKIEVSKAMAIVAGGKVVNDSLNTEIAINKLANQIRENGENAVQLVAMGRRLLDGPAPRQAGDS